MTGVWRPARGCTPGVRERLVMSITAEEKKQIRSLLEQFKKQIRVGYFELPNALPEGR